MQNRKILTVGLLLGSTLGMPVQAEDIGYWQDSWGAIVHTPYVCVRSSGWTQEKTVAECGGKMKVAKVEKVMDADGDGVADNADKCPGTTAGIRVDASGCPLDSDKDGVADSSDKCPGTAAGVKVSANGCPVDTDKDGVADYADKCPDTGAGIKVDARGCPADSDKDGVADSYDQCPNTVAGAKVFANGCAVDADSDNDGIVDANDKCPNTAAGIAVNKSGCELKADIRLDKVQFKTSTAVLSAESRNILDGIAKTLIANEHLNFEIAGHTDNRGDYNYNVQLSKRRAQSVRDYLIGKGVAPGRLTARGYGPDQPVVSNDTSAGRTQNRRVELVLQ